MSLPWSDMKLAFPCDNPERLWRAIENGKATLPEGWQLVETDCSGARCVAIFRVEETGFVPSPDMVIKGRDVKATIRRFGR